MSTTKLKHTALALAVAFVPMLAVATADAHSSTTLLSATDKTIVEQGGSIVITLHGAEPAAKGRFDDAAVTQEAIAVYRQLHGKADGIVAIAQHDADGTAVVTASHYAAGDTASGQPVTDGSGLQPPPTPPPPPDGTVPNSVSQVTLVSQGNGYTRTTVYTRTLTPDPHAPGDFIDGPWGYPSSDTYVTDPDSGSHGRCKPEAPAEWPQQNGAQTGH